MRKNKCSEIESQKEIDIDGIKPSIVVFKEIEGPIIFLLVVFIVGIIIITISFISSFLFRPYIGFLGLLLIIYSILWNTLYITEIGFDMEALYIGRSARAKKYRKIIWRQIENIRVRIEYELWNSYLIWIDTVQNKQVLPYWLGPPWPGKYERDIREAFFIEVKKKLEEEKEKRKQEAVANIVDINKQTAEQETTS